MIFLIHCFNQSLRPDGRCGGVYVCPCYSGACADICFTYARFIQVLSRLSQFMMDHRSSLNNVACTHRRLSIFSMQRRQFGYSVMRSFELTPSIDTCVVQPVERDYLEMAERFCIRVCQMQMHVPSGGRQHVTESTQNPSELSFLI